MALNFQVLGRCLWCKLGILYRFPYKANTRFFKDLAVKTHRVIFVT